MTQGRFEIIGENYRWHESTQEIEDNRDGTRRPDSSYQAKVDVYENRVRAWFLDVARREIACGPSPADYVALSIALAYLEGVERYRQGTSTPYKKAGEWFKTSAKRVFPSASSDAIDRLWSAVRNGLFHSGFTEGQTLLSHDHQDALAVSEGYLLINPVPFVAAVIQDFDDYLRGLRADPSGNSAACFVRLWDCRWERT